MLHHALVQHLLEDLETIAGQLPQFAGQATTTELVIHLLPALDRAGVLLRVIEGTDFGEHMRHSSAARLLFLA